MTPTVPPSSTNLTDANNPTILNRAYWLFLSALASALADQSGVTTGSNTLIMTVPGTIGIDSDVAPLVVFSADETPTAIVAYVKQAPVSQGIVVNLNDAGAQIGTVTIEDGETSGTGTISGTITAGDLITMDITQVGLSFPGSGLTVQVTY